MRIVSCLHNFWLQKYAYYLGLIMILAYAANLIIDYRPNKKVQTQ